MEQAAAVFASHWDEEVAALRLEDIGLDRLYVRHSWRRSEGLKECKNGEEREVIIPKQIQKTGLSI